MKLRLFLLLSIGLFLFVRPESYAAKPASATTPGTYKDWHDMDEVTIVQPFQLGAFKVVAVPPLDTRNATLPPPNDNSYADVKAALAGSAQAFIAGLQSKLGGLQVQAGQGGGANALVVRVRITKTDPGSRAARYFVGFGAGAAKIGIAGEIVDGRTGKVLVRFAQERRSFAGGFGGDYRDLLDRTLHQVGGDVAGLLRAF
ncbi:MAG: DUF4410 domain-containing protein [Chthoniobacterales bacterium]